ncbi:MAG: PAC2 family protein [Candidatus Bathyarchaeota archaeon]|nr:PAC2 family protein [Candidatus Bathyarchaeota archaeon]
MSSSRVTVVETTPIDSCRYCVVGFPDVGLVSSIALGHAVLEAKMAEFGHLESDDFPPVIVVHDGAPKPPMRLYRRNSVVSVVSEMPVDFNFITPVTRSIVDWVKSKHVELLVTTSGIAVPNRLEIDVPEVYGVASSPDVRKIMDRAEVKALEEGFVAGIHAALMKESLEKRVPCLILLAQSHLKFPDPGAAASLIDALNRLVGLDVDTKELLVHEDEVRLRLRALMQRTQDHMQQVKKGQEQEIPLLYT